jgi:hypothetical protein
MNACYRISWALLSLNVTFSGKLFLTTPSVIVSCAPYFFTVLITFYNYVFMYLFLSCCLSYKKGLCLSAPYYILTTWTELGAMLIQ